MFFGKRLLSRELALCDQLGLLKQLRQWIPQGVGNARGNFNRRCSLPSFEQANGCSMNARSVSQVLVGEALIGTECADKPQ